MMRGILARGARKTLDEVTRNAPAVEIRNSKGSLNWLPGVLLGLTVGAVAGLMFAPQPGAETRTAVQSRVGEYTKDLPTRTSSIMDSARGLSGKVTGMFAGGSGDSMVEDSSSRVGMGRKAHGDMESEFRASSAFESETRL